MVPSLAPSFLRWGTLRFPSGMLALERISRLENDAVVVLESARFPARNPAFDVTPAELIAAIVTEQGVHRAPVAESPGGVVAV
jgi:translation initiation factor 2B subunit (eIF-2B alpha/beta/delta family)